MKKNITLNKNTDLKFILKPNENKDINLRLSFAKPNISISISAISICKNGKKHNINIELIHNKPFCESDIKVISFVKGKNSKFSWNGNVIVKKNAKDTKTYQYNKNYLLSKNATVLAKPNLSTETVANAGHKSIIVDYDKELFFYLQTK